MLDSSLISLNQSALTQLLYYIQFTQTLTTSPQYCVGNWKLAHLKKKETRKVKYLTAFTGRIMIPVIAKEIFLTSDL